MAYENWCIIELLIMARLYFEQRILVLKTLYKRGESAADFQRLWAAMRESAVREIGKKFETILAQLVCDLKRPGRPRSCV